MKEKYIDYLTVSFIAFSVIFLVFFVGSLLFAPQDSYLREGYLGKDGNINLNNIAVVVVLLLFISVLANKKLVKKRGKASRLTVKTGNLFSILVLIFFAVCAIGLVVGVLTGQLFSGIQF